MNMDIPAALVGQVQALLAEHQRETLAATFAPGTRVRLSPRVGIVQDFDAHDKTVRVDWAGDGSQETWEAFDTLEPVEAAPEQREYKAGDKVWLAVKVEAVRRPDLYTFATTWGTPLCDVDGIAIGESAKQLRPRND